MGPATAAIELVDKKLTFEIIVNVVDVTGGNATGETMYACMELFMNMETAETLT